MKYRSSLLAPAHPGGPGKRVVKRLWCVPLVVWLYMTASMAYLQWDEVKSSTNSVSRGLYVIAVPLVPCTKAPLPKIS